MCGTGVANGVTWFALITIFEGKFKFKLFKLFKLLLSSSKNIDVIKPLCAVLIGNCCDECDNDGLNCPKSLVFFTNKCDILLLPLLLLLLLTILLLTPLFIFVSIFVTILLLLKIGLKFV